MTPVVIYMLSQTSAQESARLRILSTVTIPGVIQSAKTSEKEKNIKRQYGRVSAPPRKRRYADQHSRTDRQVNPGNIEKESVSHSLVES